MAAATPATAADSRWTDVQPLDGDWELAAADCGAHPDPSGLDDLEWMPAQVPGTVAGALGREAFGPSGEGRDLDDQDWWFRTRFEAPPAGPGEEVVLRLDGVATVAEVYLNGELVAELGSMFVARQIDVGSRLHGANELAIRCRALNPLLRVRRRPRARWRTRLVAEGNLRFFRTMLIGHAPGFAAGPSAVGPWRPVSLERRRAIVIEDVRVRARLSGDEGVLSVRARLRPLDAPEPTAVEVEIEGDAGTRRAQLNLTREGSGQLAEGELRIPDVTPWWPHTHGRPALYSVRLVIGSETGERVVAAGRVGFRSIAPGPSAASDPIEDGLDLHVNGCRIFARGAVWTPVDSLGLAPSEPDLREALEAARDAGMNMLRVPGIGAYETDAFHDLCDELGLLLWQDFMFANLDYPVADEEFRALVDSEAEQLLERLAPRPSLAVLCGNSEVEQQVAMLGLDPALGRGELFGEILPALTAAADCDAVYLPSAPCGGDRPFRPDRGVANYFGVGAYLRPLEDARRSGVRFASECLAFANVPDERAVEAMLPAGPAVHHPRWKAGVPRDVGSGWDFEDVRDHYLEELYGLDARELRSVDHERYLELSRAVSGDVMAEVFGEWRRAESPCGGGLVLWLRDLALGAGWGLVDSLGAPKVAYHHVRRALAPIAVWSTDEGLGGVAIHVANDGPEALGACLRVALYRDGEHLVETAEEALELEGRSGLSRDVESMIGRFVDASWSYRFGPPAQDVIVASLEAVGGGEHDLISQAFRFPAGRPAGRTAAAALGLEASSWMDDGSVRVRVRSRRLAYGVRVHAAGFTASDDAFSIEPGGERTINLLPRVADASIEGATISALNLQGTVRVGRG